MLFLSYWRRQLQQNRLYAALLSATCSCNSGQQTHCCRSTPAQKSRTASCRMQTRSNHCLRSLCYSHMARGCMLWHCTTAKASPLQDCKQWPPPAHSCRCSSWEAAPSASPNPLLPQLHHPKGRSLCSTRCPDHAQQPSPPCCKERLPDGTLQPDKLQLSLLPYCSSCLSSCCWRSPSSPMEYGKSCSCFWRTWAVARLQALQGRCITAPELCMCWTCVSAAALLLLQPGTAGCTRMLPRRVLLTWDRGSSICVCSWRLQPTAPMQHAKLRCMWLLMARMHKLLRSVCPLMPLLVHGLMHGAQHKCMVYVPASCQIRQALPTLARIVLKPAYLDNVTAVLIAAMFHCTYNHNPLCNVFQAGRHSALLRRKSPFRQGMGFDAP